MASDGHVRVKSWAEFKRLVAEKNPGSVVFVLEQNGFSVDKEVTVLRLIMLHERRYYIFIDTPRGDVLRETGVPLRRDRLGARFLDEAEVKAYIERELAGLGVRVFSFWTT